MPSRSTSSEYQPAPFSARSGRGVPAARTAISGNGVKPNMCCAPATNGERAMGKVAPSQPASTTKMMKVSGSY